MIVGILGPAGCGGTFLDWSLQFLAGANKNWVVECKLTAQRSEIETEYEQDILFDPLKNSTAHNHNKTHPNHNSLPLVLDSFNKQLHYNLHSFYFTNLVNAEIPTYTSIIKSNPDIKFIAFNFTSRDSDALFYFQYEKVPLVSNRFLKVINDQTPNLSLWEQREILSLSYPRIIAPQISETIVKTSNSILMTFGEMLLELDWKIFEIFNFLNIPIDNQRLEQWKNVYKTWQQNNHVNFYKDLDKIVDAIVNDYNLSLEDYGMTFAKEVTISSILLHRYNLALKIENLEKLPNNTQNLHKLLETNIYHNLN